MDLFPPNRAADRVEIMAELEREIAQRRRVYPRWVADGKLKQAVADRRIQLLEVAIEIIGRD